MPPVSRAGRTGLEGGVRVLGMEATGSQQSTRTAVAEPIEPGLRSELVELTSTLCHALNDPKRLLLLHVLSDGPTSVGALATALDASVANVSQHLAVLRERGLVDTERDGLNVIYSLRYPELIDAISQLRSILRAEVRRRSELLP
jgi:DNA-binding transcriptional ArsR family regulator